MSLDNSDFLPTGLSGNIAIRSKAASFAKTIVNDAVTEGTEKFVAKLRKNSPTGNVLAESNIVIINDTSRLSPLPSYSLSVTPNIADEGNTLTFNLTSLNVSAGTNVPYQITGIDSADIGGQSLTGNFVVDANGVASVTATLSLDETTEGFETLTMTLVGVDPTVAVNVLINDISKTPDNLPTYSLTTSKDSVNETLGTNSFTITLLTNNVAAGNLVPYTITGVSSADIDNQPLTGTFTVQADGTAFRVFNATPDQLTEGVETFVITLDNITPLVRTSVNIIDTSQSLTPATYSLNASVSQVNEGGTVRFTLATTGLPNLARIPYIITGTGVNAGDYTTTSPGFFIINSNGIGVVDLNITLDQVSEGPEILTLKLDGITPEIKTSVIINDTSTAPKPGTYALSADKTQINEGESVTFTLTTINVDAGTQVPYNIQGVNSADIGGASITGNFLINQQGVAQVTLTRTATEDEKTEGDETMTLRLTGKSQFVSVLIKDTSRDPIPEYTLSHTRVGIPTYVNSPLKQTINQWYRTYLGRDADEDGLDFYVSRHAAGDSFAVIEASIAQSPEALAWDKIQRVSEGTSVDVKLVTANVAIGTQVPYTITGVTTGDLGGASLTGTIPVTTGTFRAGEGNIRLNISADRTTEGIETLKLALDNITPEVSTSFEISDTSIARGFSIDAVTTTDEAKTIKITLNAFGYRNGSIIPFVISGQGINDKDLSSSRITWNAATSTFTGSFTVNDNTDSFDLLIIDDATPEGTETFTISITATTPTVSHTVTINDTSTEKSGTAVLSDTGSMKLLAELPLAETWVAFKMIGAGGSGGGHDGQPTSGYGYRAATDGAYTSLLNTYGIWKEGAGASWTGTFNVYFPYNGTYKFYFTTDNYGSFWIDNDTAGKFDWSDFKSDGSTTKSVTAGTHQVTISVTNTGGPASVALLIYGPGGGVIWETGSQAYNGGGAGGAGVYTQGVVKLPLTTVPKLLFGGAGEPGPGGQTAGAKTEEMPGIGWGGAASINYSAKTVNPIRADGGYGGKEGPGGSSGGGGAGGGASTIFYAVEPGPGLPYGVIPIAIAGGGGGGGGGSLRILSRQNNANGSNGKPNAVDAGTFTGLYLGERGQDATGDGGGGGGGGGGQGTGGIGGADGVRHGEGGGNGVAARNISSIPAANWASWDYLVTLKDREQWPTGGIMYPEGVEQPFNWVSFGRGGPGSRPWFRGVGGLRGAIAIYYTTKPSPAPTLNQVPPWTFPQGTVSLPPGPSPLGVGIFHNGTILINSELKNWYSIFPSNSIGSFFEVKFETLPASQGGTAYNVVSNIVLGQWYSIPGYGLSNGLYVRPDVGGVFNLNVQIRRRSDGVVVADRTYENVVGTSPSSGCCVVSTALADTGIWSGKQKNDLIDWCEKYLHNTRWGECFRRGYQVLGSWAVRKLIRPGGWRQKYATWSFDNGTNLVRGKKFSLISIPNSFVWITGFMLIGAVVTKEYANKTWKKLYSYKETDNGNDN